jgi:hypothetical protein
MTDKALRNLAAAAIAAALGVIWIGCEPAALLKAASGDVSGTWQGNVAGGGPGLDFVLVLEQSGTALAGVFKAGGRYEHPVTTGSVSGRTVRFTVDMSGRLMQFTGTLNSAGTRMEGTAVNYMGVDFPWYADRM